MGRNTQLRCGQKNKLYKPQSNSSHGFQKKKTNRQQHMNYILNYIQNENRKPVQTRENDPCLVYPEKANVRNNNTLAKVG